jgi:hypothetical protein
MEEANESSTRSRRGWWWWSLIALLPVIYLLLMAPFNAWMIRGHLSAGSMKTAWFDGLNGPVDWMVSRSEVTENGWERYQQWWIDVIVPPPVD